MNPIVERIKYVNPTAEKIKFNFTFIALDDILFFWWITLDDILALLI